MYSIKNFLKEEASKYLIYCDMDGVLTNFQDHFIRYYHNEFRDTELYTNSPESFPEVPQAKTTQDITDKLSKKNKYAITRKASKEYWSEMPWHPEGKKLWNLIKPFNPIILSTPSQSKESKEGKMAWVKKNLKISTVILSDKKYQYVEDNLFVPKDKQEYKRILIDDTPKKIIEWKDAGGIGILHKSYRQTVKELKKLDIIP